MSWHPETVAQSVRAELSRFGPVGALGDIVAAWPEAVGDAIAANAWPARSGRDGTLHVAVSSSVWAFELTQLEPTVRERLHLRLGASAPARLRFAVGPLPERGREGVTSPSRSENSVERTDEGAGRRISAEALAAGEEIAAPIENEELRALVAKAAAASLALARGRAAGRPLW